MLLLGFRCQRQGSPQAPADNSAFPVLHKGGRQTQGTKGKEITWNGIHLHELFSLVLNEEPTCETNWRRSFRSHTFRCQISVLLITIPDFSRARRESKERERKRKENWRWRWEANGRPPLMPAGFRSDGILPF